MRHPDQPIPASADRFGETAGPDQRTVLRALQESSQQLLVHDDFKDTAEAIYRILKKLLGAAAGYVALLSPDGRNNDLLFLDYSGVSCSVDPTLPMPVRGLRAEAYRTGRVAYDNDFSQSPWVEFLPPGHARLDSVLFAPLKIKGETVGVIGLANKPGGFSETDVQTAGLFGELAAIALSNSRNLQRLRTSEEHFRAVAQTATDAIISADGEGSILFWNSRAASLFGFSEEEALGRPVTIIIPERLQERHCAALDRVRVTGLYHLVGRTLETTGRHRDGREVPIEISLSQWEADGAIRFTAIIRDIFERKEIETALKASEERYRIIFEGATEGIIVADVETRAFQYINPAVCTMFGYPEKEFLRLTVSDLHPTESVPRVLVDFEALAQGLKTVASGVPCLRKNQTSFFADITATRMKIGERTCLVGFFTDTTERKKAENILQQTQIHLEQEVQRRTAELQAANTRLQEEMVGRQGVLQALELSERRFRAIFNQSFQFIGLLSPEGIVQEINQSTLTFLQLRYNEVVGRPLWELRLEAGLQATRRRIREAVGAAAQGNFVRFEFSVPLSSGPPRHIDFSLKPVFDEGNRIIWLIVEGRDVTLYKQIEGELRVSETRLRLLSSQVLSAQESERKRIAKELHDGIGQYLSAIKYRVEHALVLQESAGAAEDRFLQDMVPVIQEAIEEIRRICMDLRPSILDDLGIKATLSWFCREFQKTYTDIHIEQELSVREDQIQDALKIIIFRITQEALNNVAKHGRAGSIRLALAENEQGLGLEIQDNGRGFSVKEATEGAPEGRGLGLAGMKERTELSGGAFQVISEEGRGTLVRAVWPLINADAGSWKKS
jgi:PAS domain S-box-containing protein